MNKTAIAVCMTLLVSACQTPPEKPPYVEPVREVKEVPVPVACVKRVPEEPRLLLDSMNENDPLDLLSKAAVRDLLAMREYANKLRIEVIACSEITSPLIPEKK